MIPLIFLLWLCVGVIVRSLPLYSDEFIGAESLRGNGRINVNIVKREDITKEDAQLFKQLYFQEPDFHSFSFKEDGEEYDEDCYDDTLPTNIIIHKGSRCKESDLDFVDRIREINCGKGFERPTYGVRSEKSIFKFDQDEATAEEVIKIQSLKKKIISNSAFSFLDDNNDVVYLVNGTSFNDLLL